MHIYCLLPETNNLVCRNYEICVRANTVRLCSPDFSTTRSSTQTQEQQVLRRNGRNRQHSATCARTKRRQLVPCGVSTASEPSAVCTYRCKCEVLQMTTRPVQTYKVSTCDSRSATCQRSPPHIRAGTKTEVYAQSSTPCY
jgi:hypothetical protein